MTEATLASFQKLTGLSDRAVMWLLIHRKLTCSVSKHGDILVDIDSIDQHALQECLVTRQADLLHEHSLLVEERIAGIVSEKLSELVRDVIANMQTK